jgi:hypothetical protein
MNLGQLKIKLFADGADLAGMKAMYANPASPTTRRSRWRC